ncbi:hypothetical protein PAF17_16110 [Paracoccus sp. Z330]|uniref:Uncharacterized protein n=1 Tax=Paracoccus onchidii TaxID=3017813 RepID=A0ABT4ZI42_9RHOB|nr:hypothetical protein [Paracoccus onchidii]MDB6179017.1 hypothetical protein [Paracoccus onchidii]
MMLPVIIRRKLKGANGRNWPGFVVLNPDAPMPAAVLAQEVWESRHKLNPFTLLKTVLSDRAKRRMELMGHEVEVQAAILIYDSNAVRHRNREAAAMKAGYDGIFAGYSIADIQSGMSAQSDEARRWVRKNMKRLERFK